MNTCSGTFEVDLLPYAWRGHTRNEAHCRSPTRNVLNFDDKLKFYF